MNANKEIQKPPTNTPTPAREIVPKLTINWTIQIAKMAGKPAKNGWNDKANSSLDKSVVTKEVTLPLGIYV